MRIGCTVLFWFSSQVSMSCPVWPGWSLAHTQTFPQLSSRSLNMQLCEIKIDWREVTQSWRGTEHEQTAYSLRCHRFTCCFPQVNYFNRIPLQLTFSKTLLPGIYTFCGDDCGCGWLFSTEGKEFIQDIRGSWSSIPSQVLMALEMYK